MQLCWGCGGVLVPLCLHLPKSLAPTQVAPHTGSQGGTHTLPLLVPRFLKGLPVTPVPVSDELKATLAMEPVPGGVQYIIATQVSPRPGSYSSCWTRPQAPCKGWGTRGRDAEVGCSLGCGLGGAGKMGAWVTSDLRLMLSPGGARPASPG